MLSLNHVGTEVVGFISPSHIGLLSSLIYQLAPISALVVLISLGSRHFTARSENVRRLVLGLAFGTVAIFGAKDPVLFPSGIAFESSSILTALSGAFAGPVPTVIAAALGTAYRWHLGGDGAIPSCLSMAASAALGILVGRLPRSEGSAPPFRHLVLLALGTSSIAFAATTLLPQEIESVWHFALPVAVANSAGILLLGLVLKDQHQIEHVHRDLVLALATESQLAERHRVITNNVADGLVTLDEDGCIRSFNSSAEWMFGYPAEDVIGRDIAILVPGGGNTRETNIIHRYIRSGKARTLGTDGDLTARRKNGDTFLVEIRIAEFRLDGARLFTANVRDVSGARSAEEKRAHAESMLRDGEARFHDCARASSDYLWECDVEQRFTSWEGGFDVVDIAERPWLGRKRWEIADSQPDQEPWLSHLVSIEARQPFRNFIFKMPRPNGDDRWIKSSGTPFFAEDGTYAGYRGASSDITEAVTAQRDLQARAQQQQSLAAIGQLALQECGPDGLLDAVLDVLTRTLDVGRVAFFEKLPDEHELVLRAGLGFRLEDLGTLRVPCSWSSLPGAAFLSEPTVTQPSIALERTIGQSELSARYGILFGMAAGVGEVSRRSGSLFVGTTEARRFTRTEASFLHALASILGAALDRFRAEASLHLRDRALEATGQGLVIADATKPGAPSVYMNSVFKHTRGRSRDQDGSRLDRLFRSDQDPEIGARILRELLERGRFSTRIRTRHPREGDSWHDVTITHVGDEKGNVTHFVAVETDVTARVNMEIELLQAKKMDAVGKLTGGVAHDFNNLLTVILGNAELLVEDLADSPAKLTAEMVIEAAERGSDLVQRLLAFGRRQALQPENVDVDGTISSLATLLRRTIGESITLRTALSCGGIGVLVDRSHLETAVLNLVTNARDAMASGGTLTISTRTIDTEADEARVDVEPGRYAALVVTDTGSGMPPEILDRVFEPFFTTKELGKGTGLGLSTVYGFVQQSGGRVHVSSEVGRGTSVEILLPIAAGVAETVPHVAARALRTGGERVLLVEDQDDVRSYVAAQLTSFGYDVVSAGDATSALEALKGDREVCLLFSDILLPAGLDGIELAECALSVRPDLKLLFTSGYSDYAVERRSRLLDQGVPLLKKPYRRLELAAAIRDAIDRGGAIGRRRDRGGPGAASVETDGSDRAWGSAADTRTRT